MDSVIFCVTESVMNEECPDTFRHPGYYEKIYLVCVLYCKFSIAMNYE